MHLLSVSGLSKTFGRQGQTVEAITQTNLTIDEGEFVVILGPSGCGKSTFLHIVGGFEESTGGEILFKGQPVRGIGPDRGMMFQDFSLFPWLTVEKNVAWPLRLKRQSREEKEARVESCLSVVGLGHYRKLYPAQLSGGMKQRVALARLLVLDPDMLLMDEPFGALDAQTRELMQEELLSIWQERRKTAMFVTHDIDEALFLATRLIVFTARPGRIKAEISVDFGASRPADIRKSSEFHRLRDEVWDLLREEVLAARAIAR
jgi:NitT/TauT family transport system ATP-binding protein